MDSYRLQLSKTIGDKKLFYQEVIPISRKFFNIVKARWLNPGSCGNWLFDATTLALLPQYHLSAVVALIIFFCFLRNWLNVNLFEFITVISGVKGSCKTGLKESLWKLLYYSFTCSYGLYFVCKFRVNEFNLVALGHMHVESIPLSITILYMVEIAFYLYSLYSIYFFDVWRKDSYIMTLHHIITVLLLLYSFNTRFVYIGIWVTSTFEINDILLELTKTTVYIVKSGRKHLEPLKSLFFSFFGISWFYCRLYMFYSFGLRKLILGHDILYTPKDQLIGTMAVMLIIIFFMNVYWFLLILKAFVRALIADGIDDIRETDDDEKLD